MARLKDFAARLTFTVVVAASVGISGCGLILGLGDFKDETGGGGAASSSSASSSSAGGGGQGGNGGQGGQGGQGIPAKLVVDMMSIDFNSIVIDTVSPTETVRFTNQGGEDTGAIATQLTGANANQYAFKTDGCMGKTLSPGESCLEVIEFKPTMAGEKIATLTGVAAPGGAQTVDLSGLGILPGQIGIAPTMFDFMTIDVGSMIAQKDFVVSNNGGMDTGMLATTLVDAGGDFQVVDGCNGMSLPAMTGTCTVSVVFAPMSFGDKQLGITVQGMPGGMVNATAKGHGQDYFPLDVTLGGAGSGVVTSMPAGINCGATCDFSFARDTMVTLTATPQMGSTFTGWSGACSGTGTCALDMNMAQAVTANFALTTVTLTVMNSFIGTTTGTVVSTAPSSPAINCGATCTAVYPYGTNVVLAAQPGASSYLKGWTGGITSTSYTPTVVMNGNMTVTATFTPANKIFIATKAYTGNIGGIAPANLECNTEAAAAGLTGTYVSWLSTSTVNAGDPTRLNNARGWVRPDGLPVADTISQLEGFSFGGGHVFYPLRLSAAGADLGAGYWLATGTQNGMSQAGFTCGDWTSSLGTSDAIFGYADAGTQGWGSGGSTTCNATMHVACLETDYAAVVNVPAPTNPRYLFLSKGSFSPASTINGADMICASEATAAGLPGTYKALLAPSGATAASRFTVHNQEVVRPDGVNIAPDFRILQTANAPILAAPEIAADGTVSADTNGAPFTGAVNPTTAGTAATTCNNWATNSAASSAESGRSNFSAGTQYFGASTTGCDATTMRVYCLEL